MNRIIFSLFFLCLAQQAFSTEAFNLALVEAPSGYTARTADITQKEFTVPGVVDTCKISFTGEFTKSLFKQMHAKCAASVAMRNLSLTHLYAIDTLFAGKAGSNMFDDSAFLESDPFIGTYSLAISLKDGSKLSGAIDMDCRRLSDKLGNPLNEVSCSSSYVMDKAFEGLNIWPQLYVKNAKNEFVLTINHPSFAELEERASDPDVR